MDNIGNVTITADSTTIDWGGTTTVTGSSLWWCIYCAQVYVYPCPHHTVPQAVVSPPTIPTGWECPRCKLINAPHVNQCTCRG